MRRMRLSFGRQIKQRLARHANGLHFGHLEVSFGDRAGFVKNDRFYFRQQLKIVASFDEDAFAARPANAAKKRERHRDDQRARTRSYQKRQRPIHPDAPLSIDQRRNDGQRQGEKHHDRRIDAGEFRNKLLRLRLLVRRVFHQVENFGDGRILVWFGNFDIQHARLVDAAGNDFAAGPHAAWYRLAGQRGRIKRGLPFFHRSVQWNTLAGIDDNRLSDAHFFRIDLLDFSIHFDVGVFGTYVHERGDRLARFVDRVRLEPLADLVKQHDGDRLAVLAQHKGANRSERHQKVLVKHLPVLNVFYRLDQHVI